MLFRSLHVQTSKPPSSKPQSSEPPKPQHSESQTSKVDIPIFHNDITPDMFAPRSTQIPTIILPPPNSTQILTPISSAPIQTETIPIITTTTQSENLVYLDASDSEATISNPLQTKISNPFLLKQILVKHFPIFHQSNLQSLPSLNPHLIRKPLQHILYQLLKTNQPLILQLLKTLFQKSLKPSFPLLLHLP